MKGCAGSTSIRRAPENCAADESLPAWKNEADLARAIDSLIERGQPDTAVRLFTQGTQQGIEPSWPLRDKVAATLLHLGRATEAREIWEHAPSPPSRALQLARVATAELAAFEFESSLRTYQRSLDLDQGLTEAWFGVALLHTQRGDAGAALAAARAGLERNATPAQKAFLTAIEALVRPYAGDPKPSPP